MKRFLLVFCALLLFILPSLAQTREGTIYLEGEPETVIETLYESLLGFSFWYDASSMEVDADMSEDGQSVLIGPTAEESALAYLEIMTTESVGVMTWKFLELNAEPGTEYEESETESGASIHWFTRAYPGNAELVNIFYAVDAPTQALVAAATCTLEALEGWGARFNHLMETVSFGQKPVMPVRAVWAEPGDESAGILDTVKTTDDAEAAWVAFVAEENVRNFCILELDGDVGEDGHLHFTEKVIYRRPEVPRTQTIMAALLFYGDIVPNNGISFTDAQGIVHRYALSVSGAEEGSLELTGY